ncbi:ATP-dependent RecD-like DNA helicase [Streptomyces microflavus]
MADRITTHFGVDTLDIIENEPKRLVEVPGLGPKRTKMIAAAWEEQKAIKEVMVFLQGVGVSTSIAVRIYKKYEDASISVVKNQPYRLAADVWGIGFLTADKIAQAVGIPHDSPERVKAGLQYALSQSSDQGHCYLPEERLIADGVKLLQVDTGLVIECLAELAADPEGVVREKVPSPEGGEPITAVYLVPFHRAELSLAGQVRRLLRTGEDRMAALAGRGLGEGAGLARDAYGGHARARAGGGRTARAQPEGGRPDRRTRLREVVHRTVHRRAGTGQAGEGRAGRAHRAGRQDGWRS